MKIALVLIGIGLLAVALWIGGEVHYRSCVNAAKVTGYDGGSFDLRIDRASGKTDATRTVQQLADGCSRLPW
jgi:hypothetical protein